MAVLDRALDVVEFLRANCPWDAEQTHRSLRRYLLEETHEVVDAIDAGDDASLRDELGDLLLNVAFQIVIAEERGAFERDEVVTGLEDKMRRRHPHLHGGDPASWDVVKAREREARDAVDSSVLGDVHPGADPLSHAHRVQKRVATVGFDWPEAGGAWAKVREEVEEVREEFSSGDQQRLEEEIGDLLFAVVNFARLAGVHPTTALVRANQKFTRRFRRLEALAASRGVKMGEVGLDALDQLWGDVKDEER
ncbi:MAG: nucleoside triphosphate pyrophosphohydrolase [Gemmatimonadota bacterium]